MPATPVFPAVPDGVHRRLVRICEPLKITLTGDTSGPVARPVDAGASAEEFLERPDALDALIEDEAARVAAATGGVRPRRDVAASRLLHFYVWSAGLLFSGPWFLEGRVPHIAGRHVRLAPGTGAMTLDLRGVVYPLPPAGPAALRSAVAEHLGPVLEAFAPHVRRGPRALWGMAGDDLVAGLWTLGRCTGDEEAGIRAATAVLPGDGTGPFPGAAAFRRLRDASGATHPTRTRLGCCLYYAIAPADTCLTCPRLSDPARLARLATPSG